MRQETVFYFEKLPPTLSSDPNKLWQVVNAPEKRNVELHDEDDYPVLVHLCTEIFNNAFANTFPRDSSFNLPRYPDFSFSPMRALTLLHAQLGLRL